MTLSARSHARRRSEFEAARSVRALVSAALVGSMLLAAPGSAAPRCPLLPDPVGDNSFDGLFGDDPALDFVSADIVSDGQRFAVVMRVADLVLPPPGSPVSVMYEFAFRAGGPTYVLNAKFSVLTGKRFWLTTSTSASAGVISVFTSSSTAVPVDGFFDEDLSEIRMSVALKDLPSAPAPGAKAADFRLVSWVELEEWVFSSDFIEKTGKSYALGSAGCGPIRV